MKKAILGKKLGMTQIFSSDGLVVPVTVIEAGPCYVTQVKTKENDGYNAVQLAFGETKEKLVNKPLLGQFKKAQVPAKKSLKEFKLENSQMLKLGDKITCDIFEEGELVDVIGLTKGHGFTGTIKKYNFGRHRMSHGGGPIHRHVGSIGSSATPSKVYKGRKMAGRYGNEKVNILNLKVVQVDADRNILLIKGAVPGNKGSLVSIRSAIKAN